MVRECVSRGVREIGEGGIYSGAASAQGRESAGRGSRYIRKYKSIQDGTVERCLACR